MSRVYVTFRSVLPSLGGVLWCAATGLLYAVRLYACCLSIDDRHSDSEATLIQRSHAVQVEGSAGPSRFHPRDTMLKVLCGVIQFQFDIDGQRATLAVFIPWFGSRLDIPEFKSPACYGVLPPFKTIEIHPFLRPLREDRGRPRELDVRSKSGIAPSSSG